MTQEKAMRFNTGKPKMSYVPLFLLTGLAKVMEQGGLKYERGNWLKGGSIDQYIDSLCRHLQYIQLYHESGSTDPRLLYDVESWLPHVDHMLFNVLALRLALMRDEKVKMSTNPEFNTQPTKTKEDINVDAFLEFMEKLYSGVQSEIFDLVVKKIAKVF